MSVLAPVSSSPLQALAGRYRFMARYAVAWPIMAFIGTVLVWSLFGELEEFTIANGEVIPKGKTKIIQHLEGGIIEDIYVSEGDIVQKGQPLLLLDLGGGGINIEELQVRLDSTILMDSRMRAGIQGKAQPSFPQDIVARRPEMVQAQLDIFHAKQRELEGTISVLKQQMNAKQAKIKEIETEISTAKANLTALNRQLTLSDKLLEQGLTPEVEHLKLEAQVTKLEGDVSVLESELPAARSAVEVIRGKIGSARRTFVRETNEELGAVQEMMARVSELLSQATDQGIRTRIISPTKGVIKNMARTTIGGVVRAGEAIMEIVPTSDRLVIEARISPTDRGFVEVGQEALVKVSAYDYVRYGGLRGKVTSVAPDSFTDQNGSVFFWVIVETERAWLGEVEGHYPITPGMQASVDIKTGSRTVFNYLITPVLKMKHEAFRER